MTFVSLTKPEVKWKKTLDQDIIRSAIMAELDATSLYAAQIESLDSEEAKKVLHHIMLEEKEHIAELYCVLMKLDKEQMDKMSEVNATTCIAGGYHKGD